MSRDDDTHTGRLPESIKDNEDIRNKYRVTNNKINKVKQEDNIKINVTIHNFQQNTPDIITMNTDISIIKNDITKSCCKRSIYKGEPLTRVQLLGLYDILKSIDNKGKNRNINITTDIKYFHKLLTNRLLYKLQENGWKTSKNKDAVDKDILSDIFNIITTGQHTVEHTLKDDS